MDKPDGHLYTFRLPPRSLRPKLVLPFLNRAPIFLAQIIPQTLSTNEQILAHDRPRLGELVRRDDVSQR